MIKIGEKIRFLRKQRNISQEVLANYLGVSFQAVSKWETESAMPDVTLIPAIASFFGVSTEGEDMFEPAEKQKVISFNDLIYMYERLAQYYEQKGEIDKSIIQLEIVCRLILAVKEDFLTRFHRRTLFEAYGDKIPVIQEKISLLKN